MATFECCSPTPLAGYGRHKWPESPRRHHASPVAASALNNGSHEAHLRKELAAMTAQRDRLRADVRQIRGQIDAERAAHVAVLINSAIAEGRIPSRDRNHWILRFKGDFQMTKVSLENMAPDWHPSAAGFVLTVERNIQAGHKLGAAVAEAASQNPRGHRAWLNAGGRPGLPTSPR